MFELMDTLKFSQKQKDYTSVLACEISKQLAKLGTLPLNEVQQIINQHYNDTSENYKIVEEALNQDAEGEYLITYCLYALIVNNINALDQDRLDLVIAWLQDELHTHPEYVSILKSLTAIHNARAYVQNDNLELPTDCYLNLAGALLPEVNLSGKKLKYANFAGADLSGAKFNDANLGHAILANANLELAQFVHAEMEHVDLRHANMHKANLASAFLRLAKANHAVFTNAILSEASLILSDLTGANFTLAILKRATLPRAILTDANFTEADLESAKLDLSCSVRTIFNKAKLQHCGLQKADLSSATFKEANLGLANLSDSTTKGTSFELAIMNNAILHNVVLDGNSQYVILDSADLRGTDLSSSTLNLHAARLTNTFMDEKTCFVKAHKNLPAHEQEEYQRVKCAQLESANISYLTVEQLSDKAAFTHALDRFYGMLSKHPDLKLLQKAISQDVQRHVDEMEKTNPSLVAELMEVVADHNLFNYKSPLMRYTSNVSRSLFGMFAIDNEERELSISEREEAESNMLVTAILGPM